MEFIYARLNKNEIAIRTNNNTHIEWCFDHLDTVSVVAVDQIDHRSLLETVKNGNPILYEITFNKIDTFIMFKLSL